ncbi:MAG: hypothetical protein WDO15_14835 [Bacteroidota bacterium]
MKPIRLILLMMCVATATAFAQAPQRFNYQAVARDGSGNPIADKTIAVKTSIVDGSAGGTVIFSETFTPATSKQGLFSIQIGSGNIVTGAFSSVTWDAGAKFLKVEIDPAGGSSFTLLGTSQLLSVPYALAADRLVTPMSIKDLSDVSDTTPNIDQVLKWDGTSWVPGTGAGSITTSAALEGDGSSATPLTIAQQSASNGQVLQWNGTQWKPATISGGVGDNWGTQNVITNTTLSGAGTSASPLTIAQNGATPGLVLKWSGTAWVPSPDGGDNWGTAKVNASTQFDGDGTPVNPLKLAQQGATTGQFLKWSGTGWIPGDGGGSLTLPASASVADPGVALQIQNNTGTGVVGINNNGTAANVYGIQGRVLTSTGAGTAGVYGLNGATGSNGFGVLGQHNGSGTAVNGEVTGSGIGVNGKANGASGTGVYGSSLGASGYGVIGIGNTGVSGTSNTAAGVGIYGNATSGGYAGWFDERVAIKSNSSSSKANLTLGETETTDKARLQFNNSQVGKYWEVNGLLSSAAAFDRLAVTHFSGGDILTVQGDKKVGINVSNPHEALEINGNLQLNGNIVANSALGQNGQVLQTQAGVLAWGSGTNALYSNTRLHDQTADLNNISTGANTLSGLNSMPSFTFTGPAMVIITFSHGQLVSNGTGDVDLQVEVGFMNSSATVVINKAVINDVILNNKKKSISYTHHCSFGAGGTYLPYVYVGTTNGGKFNALSANGAGQVTIQIIPQ